MINLVSGIRVVILIILVNYYYYLFNYQANIQRGKATMDLIMPQHTRIKMVIGCSLAMFRGSKCSLSPSLIISPNFLLPF